MDGRTLRNELTKFKSSLMEVHAAGENNPNKMSELFVPIARKLLFGGYFEVSSGDKVVRRIFPYTVEFYYHEEEGQVKDYIVYHRNSDNPSKDPIEPFQINTFHTHLSGIDVTFEGKDEKGVFRASALIRAYQVINGETGIPSISGEDQPEINPHSTYLYNDLFMGIDIENGIQVKWKNHEWAQEGHLYNGYRFNVCEYDEIKPSKKGEWVRHVKKTKKNHPKLTPEEMQDKKPWAFSRGVFTDLCELK